MKELIDIIGYEGKYAVTQTGKIWSYLSSKFLKPCKDKDGYLKVILMKDGKRKSFFVHRLVLMTFNPVDNMESFQVNHKDENKENNYLYNLEWLNCKDNINYGTGIKRRSKKICHKIKCVETGEIFNSQKEVTIYLGQKSMSNISSCLSGKQETCGGYHWERVDGDI